MFGFTKGKDVGFHQKGWFYHPLCRRFDFFGYGGWFCLSWKFLTHYGWKELKRKCAELWSSYWRGADANYFPLFQRRKP